MRYASDSSGFSHVAKPWFFALCGVAIFACWFLVLLAGFPGFSNYDGISQWLQFTSGELTEHHPVVHTLFLGAIVSACQTVFGSFEAGVFLYCFVQGFLIAAVLAWSLNCFCRSGMGRVGIIASAAFYALNPIVGMLALSTTKDSLFSVLVLAFCVYVAMRLQGETALAAGASRSQGRQAGSGKPALASAADGLQAGICVALVVWVICLMRLNAIPAFALSTLATAILLRGTGKAKPLLTGSLVGIALAVVVTGPVYALAGVQESPQQRWNTLSVPIQQVARCYVSSSTSPEDVQRIEDLVGELGYTPNRADASVGGVTKSGCSPSQFFNLYLYLGARYPMTYAEAFLLNTEDAWLPLSVIDAYKRPVTETLPGTEHPTSAFEFTFKDVDNTHAGQMSTKFPMLRDALVWLSSTPGVEKIPLFWPVVFIWPYFWLLVACAVWLAAKRDRVGLCVIAPLAMLTLSNLFGPCMLLRYFYYLILATPLMVLVLARFSRGRADRIQ